MEALEGRHGAALALLVVVTICSAILAVLQNAMGLAVVAALGGFAAPILTSTGSGNHVARRWRGGTARRWPCWWW